MCGLASPCTCPEIALCRFRSQENLVAVRASEEPSFATFVFYLFLRTLHQQFLGFFFGGHSPAVSPFDVGGIILRAADFVTYVTIQSGSAPVAADIAVIEMAIVLAVQ